jgi:N-acetylglucosamine-6-sulfatase
MERLEYATGERELYDLRRDPDELKNLTASTPDETLARFAKRLADLKQCAGAACRRDGEVFTKVALHRTRAS